jgi:hypothetical protein
LSRPLERCPNNDLWSIAHGHEIPNLIIVGAARKGISPPGLQQLRPPASIYSPSGWTRLVVKYALGWVAQ